MMLILFPYDAHLGAVLVGLTLWWSKRKNPVVRRLERLMRVDRRRA